MFSPVLTLCVSCAMVGPDYNGPQTEAPQAWSSELSCGLTEGAVDEQSLAEWWKAFNDPILDELIETAASNNLDIKTALASVRQARATLGQSESSLWPTIDFSGSQSRSETRTEDKLTGTAEVESKTYSAGFDASWEVDVFGGLRRSAEASGRDLESSVASMYDARVSLLAEVAIDYVTARSYQIRIAIAEDNLKTQSETLEIVEAKFKAELSDELALQQARSSYESTAAQIPDLKNSLNQTLNALAVLLGQAPGSINEKLAEAAPLPTVPETLTLGAPSELLRRRPDIRAAERDLAAQTSRIGVAVADLYPKFYLSAALSRSGDGTLGFRKYPVDAWSFGPSVSWNIFDAGSTEQEIEAQKAIGEQNLYAYQATVLSAIEEAENKIYAIAQHHARLEKLAAATEAAKASLQLSRNQYSAGIVDFSEVIDAEQSLLTYQDSTAQTETDLVTDTISLYKALGGGWTPAQQKNTNS